MPIKSKVQGKHDNSQVVTFPTILLLLFSVNHVSPALLFIQMVPVGFEHSPMVNYTEMYYVIL